ncbi:Nif3-like dinuclear metal center hexameric protein [Halapricum salinum]|uniref:Nif3-like dinuclear metal center hexameric protein n=1 Tax=Halapricum salinum TaxID=1457250 RepID=A0A4D6HD34_9EURY|nr:Nif3-like dinuclear metal center hexameric protein [Halapricum salinum]QCC51893.1 Nif3-like dinuclear metal center hexameric protein [Halapricum salinum]
MRCGEIAERLDERLRTDEYADVDASANGLQVGPADRDIARVAVAVDTAVSTIEQAESAQADLLVAHHGISWGGIDRVTGTAYRRLAPLIDDGMALYVSHLPLDGHQRLGNAAGLAELLELQNTEPFGELGPVHVGQRGHAPDAYSVDALHNLLAGELPHGGEGVQVLDFGPNKIEDIAIVTGSGVDWLEEAAESGADAFVTGEGKQKAYHLAKEHGIHVFLAGHYATETFGVKSLQDLLEGWGLKTTFIHEPTGL